MKVLGFQRLKALKQSLCAGFNRAARSIRNGLSALYNSAAYDVACAEMALEHAAHEIKLEGEGLLHIADASDEVKTDLKRDALTCAAETGLALAEDVALEVTLAVAAVETAEKAANTPEAKRNLLQLAAEFGESVFSSTVAAIHAGANIFHDLERSGEEWEARGRQQHVRLPVSIYSAPS